MHLRLRNSQWFCRLRTTATPNSRQKLHNTVENTLARWCSTILWKVIRWVEFFIIKCIYFRVFHVVQILLGVFAWYWPDFVGFFSFLSFSLSFWLVVFLFYCWMLAASCLRHDTLRCFQDKVANLFQLFQVQPRRSGYLLSRVAFFLPVCAIWLAINIRSVWVREAPSLSHRPRPDSLFSISSFSLLFLFSAPPFSTRSFFPCGVNPPDVEAWSCIALSATGNPRKERIEIIYLRKSTRLHLCCSSCVA